MSVREKTTTLAKAIWIVLLISFLVFEFSAIDHDPPAGAHPARPRAQGDGNELPALPQAH